jgi:hypothetical protein
MMGATDPPASGSTAGSYVTGRPGHLAHTMLSGQRRDDASTRRRRVDPRRKGVAADA